MLKLADVLTLRDKTQRSAAALQQAFDNDGQEIRRRQRKNRAGLDGSWLHTGVCGAITLQPWASICALCASTKRATDHTAQRFAGSLHRLGSDSYIKAQQSGSRPQTSPSRCHH